MRFPEVEERAMALVEQYTRVRVVSDAAEAPALPVALRYDPAADPATVTVSFPHSAGGGERSFPRALLEEGLRAPARAGNVRIWPCGRVQTVVECHAPDEVSVIEFDSTDLIRFLRRTYTAGARYEAELTGPARRGPAPATTANATPATANATATPATAPATSAAAPPAPAPAPAPPVTRSAEPKVSG
ncbi:SsgA family sporulation/cell division regulator [Streptomyces sp. NPDC007088]|uniref:SsgA family sporulation/cell division regulator n=1 Tax=Streptomyces sp. NPDC007088 TaxID=3364773 RepID=UPI0036846B07